MQLVEIDAIDAKAAEAAFTRRTQVLRPAVLDPLIRARPLESPLGRNHKVSRIWMKRFGDESFADVRAIRVGGIDERPAEFDRAAQDTTRLDAIARLAPDAVTRKSHGAESEPVHRQIASDPERAAQHGRLVVRAGVGLDHP